MFERHGHKLLPQGEHGFVAALQFHHVFARGVGKGRVFVETHFGVAVELLQVGQLEMFVLRLLLHQIGHQHAELGAPVTHVVLRDDTVAEEGVDAV